MQKVTSEKNRNLDTYRYRTWKKTEKVEKNDRKGGEGCYLLFAPYL